MIKLWLLNKNEEITKQLTIVNAKHTDEVNGEHTLDFECYDEVNKKDRVIYKDDLNNWHEFIIEEIEENKETNTVYAEQSSYELRGDFIEDLRPTATASVHLQQLLAKTRWSVGEIDGFPSLFQSYYRQSVYKSINDLVEKFQAYRTFTILVEGNKVVSRKINIKKTSGYDEGKRFVYSKDLKGLTRTVLMDDIVTALYGFGASEEIGDGHGRRITFKNRAFSDSPMGQMYVTDEAARIEWGRNSPEGKKHVFAAYEFDKIEDEIELYHATKAKLAELSKPKVNYRADVILLEPEFENVQAGDTVAIIDNNFRGRELRLKGVVFKVEKDLIDPSKTKVEIGSYKENVADSNKKVAEYIKNFRDKAGVWDKANAFDKDGLLQASYIKEMLEAWNSLLNGAGGYVYAEPGKGIITYDRAIDDNPTSAVQITGGGWRIANSKTPSGEWDWKTIGTGDGLAGEHIIANSITVNKLASDVGASLDLSSNDSISFIVSSINTKIEEIELTPGPEGPQGESGIAGEDGKGITSTEIRYQKSTSGTETPTGQWQTFIPTVGENEYLWTRITLKYTTGPDSVSYTIGGVGSQGSKGDTGADGKGIATTIVEYQKSGSGSAVPTGSWSTTLPAVLENEYLWTRTTITYTTGSPSVAYSVGRVGKDGVKGDKGDKGETGSRGATGAIGPRGEDGTSVTGIVEFYGLSTSDTVKPTSWTEIVSEATPLPKMTSTNKYLWNYEKINFSNGSNQDTVPVIVGVYGDKGATGSPGGTGSPGVDGRSIVSIKEKYLVTSASSGVTRSTSGWVDAPTATSDTNKYLWNYEIITWNKVPLETYVDPIIIGIHGNKGDKGATGDRGPQGVVGPIGPNGLTTYNWIAYADTASGTGITGNPTGKAYVGYAFGKTSPTPVYSVAQFQTPFQLVKGTDGSPGQPGIPGTPGADGRDNFTWVKYADTPTTGMSDNPTGKKYIGFAYNKSTGTESTTYSDYEWNLSPSYFDEELVSIKSTTISNKANIEINKNNIELEAGKVTDITTRIESIDGDLLEQSQLITNQAGRIDVAYNRIQSSVENITNLDGKITTNSAIITQHENKINTNISEISSINDRQTEMDLDLDGMRVEIGYMRNDYNRIPNLNGDFGDYSYWSWVGTPNLRFYPGLKFLGNLRFNTGFKIVEFPESISGFGLSFYTNGQHITGMGRLVQGEIHSFRARRIGTVFRPFTVKFTEYNEDEYFVKETSRLFTSMEYEEYTITPHDSSRFIRLTFITTGLTSTNTLDLTEMMFNMGKPLAWQETPSDFKVWAAAQFTIRDNQIKSAVNETRIVKGVTTTNRSLIEQNADNIKLKANSIELTGKVAFDDLKVAGKTEIHGGNIKAGKIATEFLDFNGATGNNVNLIGRMRVNHSDGSYTEMNSAGIRRHTSVEARDYHYLVYAENFVYGSASASSVRWIQLPNDFKGKQFKVFFSIADTLQVASYWRALQRMVCIRHPNYSIDYTNARVPVMAYKSETITDSGNAPDITSVQGVVWAIY